MLVPKAIDAVDGKRVRIQGYMWPTFRRSGNQAVVLQQDRFMRFGRIQHDEAYQYIRVNVPKGWGVRYDRNQIVVEGTFVIEPLAGRDGFLSLYRLDVATVVGADGAELMSPVEAAKD